MEAFLLIIIGVSLIVLNMRAIKKEKSSFTSTFELAKDEMEEFEVKIGELRRDFTETITELQLDIQKLKDLQDKNDSDIEVVELSNEVIKSKEIKDKESISNEKVILHQKEDRTSNSFKVNEISRLLGEGLSTDDISEKLGIGKGEVLLIKELYIK